MLTKEFKGNENKCLQKQSLYGSRVEEYFYDYKSKDITREQTGYIFDDLAEVNVVIDVTREVDLENLKNQFIIKYNNKLTKDDRDIDLAKSCIMITSLPGSKKAKPYKEYIKASHIDFDPNIESCQIVSFNIITESDACGKDADGEYDVEHIYSSRFSVAVNQDSYIYIIVTPDVNLPTIIVSKNKLCAADNLKDIVDYVFLGNVKDGVYNSYFHTHKYSINKTYEYDDVVYGAPGIKDIEFEEKISGETYWNSDGITAKLNGNKIDVFFDSILIADYHYNPNIDSLYFVKYVDEKDIFNDLQEIEEKYSIEKFDEVIIKDLDVPYYCTTSGCFIIPDFIPIDKTQEGRIEKIVTGDDNNIFRVSDYSTDDSFRLVFNCKKNIVECVLFINDNITEYHMYTASKMLSVYYDNENHVFYTCTYSRTIKSDNNQQFIQYRDKYIVTKDGKVLDTNFSSLKDSSFTKYNILGIPSKF